MRKDVKRSLVLWPLMASITVILVSLHLAGVDIRKWVNRQIDDARRVVNGASSETKRNDLNDIQQFRDFPIPSASHSRDHDIVENIQSQRAKPDSTISNLDDVKPLAVVIPAPTIVPIVERANQVTVAIPKPRRITAIHSVSHRIASDNRTSEVTSAVPSNRPQIQADVAFVAEDQSDTEFNNRAPALSAPITSPTSESSDSEEVSNLSINTNSLFAGGSIAKPAELIEPLAPELPKESTADQVFANPVKGFEDIEDRRQDVQRNFANGQPAPEDRRHTGFPSAEQIRVAEKDNPATWPLTPSLSARLQQLVKDEKTFAHSQDSQLASVSVGDLPTATPQLNRWTKNVHSQLELLQSSPRLGSKNCGQIIRELDRLSIVGAKLAETVANRDTQIQWLQAAFAIHRRVSVWKPIWEITSGAMSSETAPLEFVSAANVLKATDQVRKKLSATGDQANWQSYLLLNEIDAAAESEDAEDRTRVARQVLNRMNHHQLTDTQLDWLSRPENRSLAAVIRPWATTPVNYAALLGQIERTESNAIDLVAEDIADTIGALRFASNTAAVDVSKVLDSHYRNANVRIALSQEFLERMLPKVPVQSKPVRTNMLGSRVTGTSQIESNLGIQFVPDSDRWSILLKTIGQVQTNSVGRKGPAAVSTRGHNQFVATTPVHITARGATVGGSSVEVNGKTRLRGINTEFDDWPLIGSLAYSIVEGQYREKTGIAQRLANRRVRQSVTHEVDETVNEKMRELSTEFSETILGPLNRLELEPQVIDLGTSPQRLVARYRMAGDFQLAAFTPRPRAPSESLLSVQIHQSAINNTLQQLIVHDEPTPLPDVLKQCMDLLGVNDVELPEDIPTDVRIRFAKHRPITFEVDEGKVWLTMRIIRLERGKRVKLSKFIVRAGYRPVTEGLNAFLIRDGHLSISGPGMSMRDRLPVRAIFNKVLSSSRTLPLTSDLLANIPGADRLAVIQLELRSGWLGLAIGEITQANNTPAHGFISDKFIATRPE